MHITNYTKSKNNLVNYANRGMQLENDINETNLYYKNCNVALIYKKPTPIKIIKMEYPYKIKEGIFEEKSTLDYNGVYKGKYIDFDAKETNSKTSFPLSNIHKHQIEHIKKVIMHKGISFIIVSFTALNEIYLLFGNDLLTFITNKQRKSIPYSYFKEKGYLIKPKYAPRIDYLKIIDKYMEVQ